MPYLLHGKTIASDDEGYLLNKDDWSQELMELMAKEHEIEINDDVLLIIKLVQEYYAQYATTPAMRGLIALLRKQGYEHLGSSVALARLFPSGAAKMASLLAGLPKPVRCT